MLSPRDPVLGGMVRTSGRMVAGGMRVDRRWSESAIPRIGKPRLRRLGAPPVGYLIRPDRCVTWVNSEAGDPTYVGGSGYPVLRDQSDATYVRVEATYPGTPGAVQTIPMFSFEPTALPSVAAMTLHFRARTVDTSTNISLVIKLGFGFEDPDAPYGSGADVHTAYGDQVLSAEWATFSVPLPAEDWWDGVLPTAAQIGAGDIDGIVYCDWYDDYPHGDGTKTVDVADVWLEVTP